MSEIHDDSLPKVVLVMDSEGIVRLHGWPEGGVVVSRGTMERFLTYLVSCDCLSVRPDVSGQVWPLDVDGSDDGLTDDDPS